MMNGISPFILEIIRKRKNVINRCTETVQYTGLRISLGILEWCSFTLGTRNAQKKQNDTRGTVASRYKN